MTYASRNFLFLNIGHALDHFFMLIFTTAVLSASMKGDFEGSYGSLLLLTTLSFFFFGGASLPAGWLGDRFDRLLLLGVFFLGCGLSRNAILGDHLYWDTVRDRVCSWPTVHFHHLAFSQRQIDIQTSHNQVSWSAAVPFRV